MAESRTIAEIADVHLGSLVRVKDEGGRWTITGRLRDVTVSRPEIEVQDLGHQTPDIIRGVADTSVTVGPWTAVGLPTSWPIEILEPS